MYKIEKGIPASLTTGKVKYPITLMEIGDSFFVESNDQTKILGSICTTFSGLAKLPNRKLN